MDIAIFTVDPLTDIQYIQIMGPLLYIIWICFPLSDLPSQLPGYGLKKL
jgi:hypothetical protein